MRGTELARILKKPQEMIAIWMREGKFKTATKVYCDHRYVWDIDDEEALNFIASFTSSST